jgi:uncharacterized membrane protein SirB2
MFTGILHTHFLFVILFVLLFLVKTILLLFNKTGALSKIQKWFKIPGIIIDTGFVLTGIYLAFHSGMVQMGNWFGIKIVLLILILPLSIISMKRKNKWLALFTLLIIFYLFGMSETKSPKMKKAEILVSEESLQLNDDLEGHALGESIFLDNCIVCHGINGDKHKSDAGKLTLSQKDLGALEDIIRNGKGNMPAYGKYLSDKKISGLALYIRDVLINKVTTLKPKE